MFRRKSTPNGEMAVSSHLVELRKCIAVIVVTFLVVTAIAYVYAPEFVCYTMSIAVNYRFVQTGVAELMAQYIKMSIIVSIVVTLPVAIWQIDKFVRPGLKRKEHILLLSVMIGGSLLFFGGAAFCFFIIIPFTLQFFLSINTVGVEGMYSLKEYISYIVSFMVAFGVIFEMPAVTVLLTQIGILQPQFMMKVQKPVIVLSFVLGAVITPPDVVSQVIVSVPVICLYECSILLSGIIYKRKQAIWLKKGIGPEQIDKKGERARSRWAEAKERVEKEDTLRKKRTKA